MAQAITAADRLVQLATRLWRAMQFALPKLPEATQTVLKLRVDDADVGWTLALLLAGWRLSDNREFGAAEVKQVLKETGAGPLVEQISSLQMLLPDSFGMFVNAAREADADYKLAGAGALMVSALSELIETQRNALHAWLRGAQVREVGRALIRRFPLPDSGRPPVWGAPSVLPVSPAVPGTPIRLRGERPDRGSVTGRAVRQAPPTTPPSLPLDKKTTTGSSPHSSAPTLDRSAVTQAYLFTLGWEGAEVERLMQGPALPPTRKPA